MLAFHSEGADLCRASTFIERQAMAPSTAVDKARALLETRREELRSELDQIEQALAGLGGRRRGPGRPRGSGSRSAASGTVRGGGKRRRRRRGGTRADHALKHVTANPGASASEIAAAMGIKPNYVYRVMAELEKDGRVRKDGKGYYAVGAEQPATADGSPGG
jgi:hypothetical protein